MLGNAGRICCLFWSHKHVYILFDFLVEQTVEKSLREEKSHTVDGSEIPNNHLGYIKPVEIMGSTDKLPTVSTTTNLNWFFWPDFWLPSIVMATKKESSH